jgi:hypothetical protein
MNALKFVGMSEGAKKRKARQSVVTHRFKPHIKLVWFKCWARDALGRIESEDDRRLKNVYAHARSKYRIGERLAPCPGCCACWGCEKDTDRTNPLSGNTLHWAGPVRKHTFECPMGPPLAGKSKRQIAQMNKWQRMLPDDCDGSGVIPAKRAQR